MLSDELRYSPHFQVGRPVIRDLLKLSKQVSEDQVLSELRRRKDMYDPLK